MMTMTSWPVPNTGPMLVPSGPRHRVPSRIDRAVWTLITGSMVGGLLALLVTVSTGWFL